VVTLEDATSEIDSGLIVEEEGTASSFRALAEVIDRHGLFCEPYTGRGHYFRMPKAGEAVSKTPQTQVGCALTQLGIRHIAAYSPEARGRSERAFRRCRIGGRRSWPWPASPRSQRPIDGSLRAIGRRTMPPSRWRRSRPAAPSPRSHRPGARDLCIQEERRIGNDTTVKWRGLTLQIPPSRRARCGPILCAP